MDCEMADAIAAAGADHEVTRLGLDSLHVDRLRIWERCYYLIYDSLRVYVELLAARRLRTFEPSMN